uniref:Uncharacterized protein n=1 Tax=viral metagenome TaxID=1070528 RepID=A0A6C0HJQ0_9ZZZZ
MARKCGILKGTVIVPKTRKALSNARLRTMKRVKFLVNRAKKSVRSVPTYLDRTLSRSIRRSVRRIMPFKR